MDDAFLTAIFDYGWRVIPGSLLIAITYFVLPRRAALAKIFMLVFAFLLVRDAMTPVGFWEFGVSSHTIWVRFADHALLLITLGITSLLFTGFILSFNPDLNRYLLWFGSNKIVSLLIGIAGAVAVVAPIGVTYSFMPLEARGGAVPVSLLLPLLFMALCGNWLEEVLFRGYLQGYFAEKTGSWGGVFIGIDLCGRARVFIRDRHRSRRCRLAVYVI